MLLIGILTLEVICMSKSKKNSQEKSSSTADSIPKNNQNQNHNAKKQALGPNTKR